MDVTSRAEKWIVALKGKTYFRSMRYFDIIRSKIVAMDSSFILSNAAWVDIAKHLNWDSRIGHTRWVGVWSWK